MTLVYPLGLLGVGNWILINIMYNSLVDVADE